MAWAEEKSPFSDPVLLCLPSLSTLTTRHRVRTQASVPHLQMEGFSYQTVHKVWKKWLVFLMCTHLTRQQKSWRIRVTCLHQRNTINSRTSPKEKEIQDGEEGIESFFKETMTENLPNMVRHLDIPVHEANKSPQNFNPKCSWRNIID